MIKFGGRFNLIFILIFAMAFAQNSFAQFYQWSSIGGAAGNGTNGVINAIVKYNNNIVAAGYFTQAGGVSVNNIALWNGTSWSALGSGVNDTVYALSVFNGSLIAGGKFTTAGGGSALAIAKWNGSAWSTLGSGLTGTVKSLAVFSGRLIAGGIFTNNGNNIAAWDGSGWFSLGTGLNNGCYALCVQGSYLYAGGAFSQADGNSANRIAGWNGSSWMPLGTGMKDDVYCISNYGGGNYIAVGGKFTQAGGNPAVYIAQWTGATWANFNFTPDGYIYAIAYYNSSLIVGGSFLNVSINGSGSMFMNRICKWDNNGSCSRMITGLNQTVKSFYMTDTSLYAVGDFTTAGGDYSFHASVWGNVPTHLIRGVARYSGDTTRLRSGVVKAVRMDVSTREEIVIDSGLVQTDGSYQITHGYNDSTDVVLFPNDLVEDHFVPTYYPSSTTWVNATKVFPSVNLDSINIRVFRTQLDTASLSNIGGHVYLNYNPILNQPGFPFSKDAIVYAKLGNIYKQFALSDSTESYTLRGLNPGTYTLVVDRIGYTSASRNVTLGTTNLDTINFYLDTAGVIGVQNISSVVPRTFSLYQNYPNPFNPATIIKFDIKTSGFVSLNIYNILGQKVAALVNETLSPGLYKAVFDGTNLPSGVYFYSLNARDFTETRKMILIK